MKALDVALQMASSSGSQVFLGAPWVPLTIRMTPERWRERTVLECLAISPHYFFRAPLNNTLGRRAFLLSECDRNKRSRQLLVDHIVRPHLKPRFTVLDYGCGPGWLASACSPYAQSVIACDISKGVLECARTLNGRNNLRYVAVPATGRLDVEARSVDLAYSFAVVQHIDDAVFQGIIEELRRVLKDGAQALFHVVLRGDLNFKTEAEWREDRSLKGRVKWHAGLHCFARDPEQVLSMVKAAGFEEISIDPFCVPGLDDLSGEHLLRFRQPRESARL
jgi:SAM-dependent methyltransferase